MHAPGTDLTPYQPPPVEEYRARFVMAPDEAAELDRQLRECMRAVLVEGTDYGPIPGGDPARKNLLKPGAQKLIQWFGFGFTNDRTETERDADGARMGVTYRCTVFKEMADGRKVTVATCEGYAGYDEDRYYTSAEAARAKAEAKERKWAQQDQRAPKPERWEGAAEYRAPWNTLLKMAQKRSLVGAAIDATAASGLFTQDMEDAAHASSVPDGGEFTGAATAAIMKLPQEVRDDLDRWVAGKKWGSSGKWTPDQWCTALQTSGYLSAKRQAAQAQPDAQPAAGGPAAPDAADPEADFVTELIAKLADVTDQLGIDARKFEVNKALASRVITPRTAAELIGDVNRKERELRQAAAA